MRTAKLLLGMFLLAGFAYAQTGEMPAGVQERETESGKVILADANGMTLYTFARDTEGKSMCNGQCAQNWPPLAAAADAESMGDWTVVARDDNSKQWAYKGMPLYTFVRDENPGDVAGDGAGNNSWHAATP